MSQMPPPPGQPYPPYQQPPYPGSPPPPGYPGGPVGYPQPKAGNGAAVASLIFGILGCVPFLTGLLAILFGVIGLKNTRRPNVGGKGLAITGILLGLLSVVLWGLFGGGLYAAYVYSKPAREVASQFAKDLSAGNVDAALARSTPTLTRPELEAAAEKLKPLGAVQDTTLPVFSINSANGITTADLVGAATFSNNNKVPYLVHLVKEGDTFKIDGFVFPDHAAAGTPPANQGRTTK